MMDLLEFHAPLWEKIQQLLFKKRIPQALLFVGPRHAKILQFANRLMAILICEMENAPCGDCRACRMLLQGIHPDISYITQEASGSAIKIEQIRGLQQDIYQTPQRASRRFIVIDPADKLNISAANALLKILEEPPSHTVFILMAEQVGSISATILSRCQKYIFPSQDVSSGLFQGDYLTIGQFYPQDTPRAELLTHADSIIRALCDLVDDKVSPCIIAAQWSGFVFDDLLWLLHLITAQIINYALIDTSTDKSWDEGELSVANDLGRGNLIQLSRRLKPVNLFMCLEQINAITKKIHHNVNMNQTLVLEDLLLGYLESSL